MKKYILPLIITFTFILPISIWSQQVFDPDEYLIYATMLDDKYASGRYQEKEVIIKDHTAIYTQREEFEKELAYVKENMLGLSRQAINDFKAKNLQPYLLEDFINQRVEYKIIREAELKNIFYNPEGWGRFYLQHPNADGIFSLSRVGFNNTKTQALACVTNQWNRHAGISFYVLLTRQKGTTWKIQETLRIWNSWCLDVIKP